MLYNICFTCTNCKQTHTKSETFHRHDTRHNRMHHKVKGPFTLSVSGNSAMSLAIWLWLKFLIHQATRYKLGLQPILERFHCLLRILIRSDITIHIAALAWMLSVNRPQEMSLSYMLPLLNFFTPIDREREGSFFIYFRFCEILWREITTKNGRFTFTWLLTIKGESKIAIKTVTRQRQELRAEENVLDRGVHRFVARRDATAATYRRSRGHATCKI